MATYRVIRNGKEYVYNYDRTKYRNNSSEYNKQYWGEHKEELVKKAKQRRIQARLDNIRNVQKTKRVRNQNG